jgi:rfaE bifunctional protein kinase chain/domain
MKREELQSILAQFAALRVLVVGDFCLDRWCAYDPELSSPSRETGIPRTAVVSYHVSPGGAGTVTNNLAALGAAAVHIIAVAGNDANGFELERALQARGVNTDYLIRDTTRQTFTYTKLLNKQTGVEDLPRLDFVNTAPPSYETQTAMVKAIHELFATVDVVLVADQSEIATGAAITERVRQTLIGAARSFPEKLLLVDSRAQIEKYLGLIVKPNEDEAVAAVQRIGHAAPSVEEAGKLLRQHLGGDRPLYVTCGERGVLLFDGPNAEAPQLIPAPRNEHPVDICGAGDAFGSGVAMALAATKQLYGKPNYVAAAQVGHLVAGVTITKTGTGTATPAEVLALFDADKAEKAGA